MLEKNYYRKNFKKDIFFNYYSADRTFMNKMGMEEKNKLINRFEAIYVKKQQMILLAHYQNSPNLNIDAIYFGDSFIKLKNLENKFPYKFISLKKQINEISKLEKFFF